MGTLVLIVAVIFSFVWPHKAVTAPTAGFHLFILPWDHALTWILLTFNFVLHGIDPSFNGMANLVVAAGALVYLLFIVMTFIIK